jgi:hypothetical protein
MGIGILQGDSVRSAIESGSLIKLEISELKKIALESFIVFDLRNPHSPTAEDFLQLLRKRKLARPSYKF